MSALVSVNVVPVAPAIAVHPLPAASQRNHWREGVPPPVVLPSAAVSVWPFTALPEIVGGLLKTGPLAMDTASTLALKNPWLSTSAKRIRTVWPANGDRSNDFAVGASGAGSPGWVPKTFARTSPAATDWTGADGFMMSTRYCWFGVTV